ncbi:MAG: 50S ribosomal protein L13 [Halobacteriales archaeon]
MSYAEFDADTVIDGRGCILGRVASTVAERALEGEAIAVVNVEELVITGDEEDVVETYGKRADLSSDRGPDYPRRPDRIAKRAVRGMLPYKRRRGREAFERVRVYLGNPYDEDGEVLEEASLDRLSTIRFVELGEVSERLGANVTW